MPPGGVVDSPATVTEATGEADDGPAPDEDEAADDEDGGEREGNGTWPVDDDEEAPASSSDLRASSWNSSF